MKKGSGKYLIKYSSGISIAIGEVKTAEAIAAARSKGTKDPNLQLVEITDQGGCVVDWKLDEINGTKEVYLKMLAVSC